MRFTNEELAERLAPFLRAGEAGGATALSPAQLGQLGAYLELLLKWNARINLTAVRSAEEMVTRHFGESLFAAENLLRGTTTNSAIDFGSGAGFPGVPIAIYAPQVRVTLCESQNKKATFLKEVKRACGLGNVEIFQGRAEESGLTAELVTMRAVEKFTESVSAAAGLVSEGGRLAMLIGAAQVEKARELLPGWQVATSELVPQSQQRVLVVARQ